MATGTLHLALRALPTTDALITDVLTTSSGAMHTRSAFVGKTLALPAPTNLGPTLRLTNLNDVVRESIGGGSGDQSDGGGDEERGGETHVGGK
jgi:hypothetical protein